MRVPLHTSPPEPGDPDGIRFHQVLKALNGNISFGSPEGGSENIDGTWAQVVSPTVADTEFIVTHNLGRVPTGWKVVSIDKAGIVYKGATAWTTSKMSLKCNQASASLTLFII